MLFNSPEFALFFPLVTLLYFVMADRMRIYWLLAASTVFYMAFIPKYVLILVFLILFDYSAGLLIAAAPLQSRKRQILLVLSLLANCGVLFFFKYSGFMIQSLNQGANIFGYSQLFSAFDFILPIGLSFHTFQSMSYTIEVYRDRQPAERNLAVYALYVMFYPQLVAGPIERPQNLLHQFREIHRFDYSNATRGLLQMLWGLFKKVVIADRLAVVVNQVYATPQQYRGLPLIIASLFFTVQIYCDFSGYSDIAIGAARVMGFRLMTNFNRPYAATNLGDFWRRWHISLSTWFRDYLYIPLGGNRVSRLVTYRNLFVVFAVSGLWHGANWTYMIWGIIHGSLLILSLTTEKYWGRFKSSPVASTTGWLITFSTVVAAWVFFRASSVHDAVYVLSHATSDLHLDSIESMRLGIDSREFFLSLVLIGLLEGIQYLIDRRDLLRFFLWPWWLRWICYYGLVLSIAWLGQFKMQQFIYFQF